MSKTRSGDVAALVARVVVEVGVVLVKPALQPLEVGGSALPVADRVELELVASHAQPPEQVGVQRDQLGVDRRIVGADRLDRELPVLAVATALRRRVAPHRPDGVELHRLRLAVHAVLEVRAHDRRRGLGSQRQRAAAAILERVHLLLDDVGARAGRAREDLGVLEHRRRRSAGSRTAGRRPPPLR